VRRRPPVSTQRCAGQAEAWQAWPILLPLALCTQPHCPQPSALPRVCALRIPPTQFLDPISHIKCFDPPPPPTHPPTHPHTHTHTHHAPIFTPTCKPTPPPPLQKKQNSPHPFHPAAARLLDLPQLLPAGRLAGGVGAGDRGAALGGAAHCKGWALRPCGVCVSGDGSVDGSSGSGWGLEGVEEASTHEGTVCSLNAPLSPNPPPPPLTHTQTTHNLTHPAGHRNISNCLSIRTAFDRCSRGLHQHARARGLWDGSAQLDFAAAFSEGGAPPAGELTPGREEEGHRCGIVCGWVGGGGGGWGGAMLGRSLKMGGGGGGGCRPPPPGGGGGGGGGGGAAPGGGGGGGGLPQPLPLLTCGRRAVVRSGKLAAHLLLLKQALSITAAHPSAPSDAHSHPISLPF
jgi:hypothetical protein